MVATDRPDMNEPQEEERCLSPRGRGRCKAAAAPNGKGYCLEHAGRPSLETKSKKPSSNLPVPVKPRALEVSVVSARQLDDNVLGAIDRMLGEIELDRAALERAKEILSR